MQPFGQNRHRPKIGGVLPSFLGEGVLGPHNVAWAEAYLPKKWHPDPSRHLATTDMDRKLGGCAPLGERELS